MSGMFGKKDEDNSIWGSYEKEKRLEEENKKAAEAEPKQFVGMFAEDAASHHMTKKKERTIIVIVVIVALIVSIISGIIVARGRRQLLRRYMKTEIVTQAEICDGF